MNVREISRQSSRCQLTATVYIPPQSHLAWWVTCNYQRHNAWVHRSVLTYCHWRSSPDILHCAVVCPQNVTLTHWCVNGEHCLVGTHSRIQYCLGLLVGSIESYYNPILPPGDSGSRSTSGSAGEGVWWSIESETSYARWTCIVKISWIGVWE